MGGSPIGGQQRRGELLADAGDHLIAHARVREEARRASVPAEQAASRAARARPAALAGTASSSAAARAP
jgi:hypothetical protein